MSIQRDDDKPKMGRVNENDDAARVGRMFRSGGSSGGRSSAGGRIGRINGQPAQPFHCDFQSVKRNQDRAGATIDYITREGDFRDREDLEYTAGDPGEVNEAVVAIHHGCRRRDERVMLTMVTELPLQSTPLARALVAERLVEYWQAKGHQAVAAVHASESNPHIHVAITARPVERGEDGWIVDRSPDRRPLKDRAALKQERAAVARIINDTMREHGIACPLYHPGKLRDVGIERQGKRRVPQAGFARGQRDLDPRAQAEARRRRREAQEHANREKAAREQRRRQKLGRVGAVPAGEFDRVRTQRDQLRRQLIERDREPPQLVEVVKQVPVPVELPEDQKPATAKQVKTMLAMAAERGLEIDDTAPMTVGTIGATIRHMMTIPRRGQQGPAQASATDAKPSNRPASATDAPKHPPLIVDPAQREDGKLKARQMNDDQILGSLDSTRSEMTRRYQVGDITGRISAKTGAEILEAEGVRRGLIEIRTRSPRNDLER